MIISSKIASWSRKKISRQITMTALALTLFVVTTSGISAYIVLEGLISSGVSETLDHGVRIISEEMQEHLELMDDNIEDNAKNTLFGNALVDDVGRETYLMHYLSGLKTIAGFPVIVLVTDFDGTPFAFSAEYDPGLLDQAWVSRLIEANNHASMLAGSEEDPFLVVAEPILFANTGLPEGALVYLLRLKDILIPTYHGGYRETLQWLSGVRFEFADEAAGRKRVIQSGNFEESDIGISREVPMSGGLEPVSLTIQAYANRAILYRPLDILLYTTAGMGVLILLVSIWMSWMMGRQLSNRIQRLQEWVNEIVLKKSLDQRIELAGEDEAAQLGRGFNKTLDRLSEAYRELEERSRLELAQSEERYKDLVDSTLQGILVHRNHVPLFVNETLAKIFGYDSPEEIMGMDLLEGIVAPNERTRLLDYRNARMNHRQAPDQYEFQGVKKDGSLIWLDSTHKVIQWDGEPAILSTQIDITERKRAEERIRVQEKQLIQADKMSSLGVLVSGVAHEINNPNNFIMINAPLISRIWSDCVEVLERHDREHEDFRVANMPYPDASEAVARLLDGIMNGSERIKNIVSNLKDFARSDTGETFQPLNLNDILRSAIVLLSNEIRKSTNSFSFEPGDNLPFVRGNFQKIEQVAINLIANACHALTDRGQAIRVQTRFDREENRVLLLIIDEGQGISQEDLERIMDPFFTTKRDRGGTGLGLSISYGIIEEHQGHLSFQSTLGAGTTATVSLPVAEPE